MLSLLPQSFYERDALVVARDLIGKLIRKENIILRITEVEAYCFPNDSANHCRFGRTKRNEAMWGPGGHAYVYLCYGMHHMLNLVTNKKNEGAAVLIRSCEPVSGIDEIKKRRFGIKDSLLLTGPGKIGSVLSLSVKDSHQPLFTSGGLEVLDAPFVLKVLKGPRIGISYAYIKDQQAPWRFAMPDSIWVSFRKNLKGPFL